MAEQRQQPNAVPPERLREARAAVDSYARMMGTRWGGVAPTFLTSDMGVTYDEAVALLLALEAEGFVYDNGNGVRLARPDGTFGRDRFYPAAWLAQMTPAQRQRWDAQHARDVEWETREAAWEAEHCDELPHLLFTAEACEFASHCTIDEWLAYRTSLLAKGNK